MTYGLPPRRSGLSAPFRCLARLQRLALFGSWPIGRKYDKSPDWFYRDGQYTAPEVDAGGI